MLRITKFLNRSTTELQIAFTEQLNPNIGINNVIVSSNSASVSNLTVKAIDITRNVLTITVSPQLPGVTYFVKLISTTSQIFNSTSGSKMQEDGVTNTVFFVGLEKENDIRDSILNDAPPVYDLDGNTFVRKYFSLLGNQFLNARTDILETGNSVYISEQVTDEIKTRGFGPTDRLNNESAYKVNRVSRFPEGATQFNSVLFNKEQTSLDTNKVNSSLIGFPSDPLSLKEVRVTETVSNSETLNNKFEDLVITLSNQNISKINSITLTRSGTTYVYDLPTYGYSLQNNYYDTNYGFILGTLNSNQFKLADAAILSGSFVTPSGSDELTVNYAYINNGIDVDTDTVVISETKTSTRETIGSNLTVFSLDNFPIVNSLDKIPTTGGVSFLDPNPSSGTPFTTTHPAFINEIAYSASNLPAKAGEYSVDYSRGQVFVYGANDADGTGTNPPVATYNYRYTYQNTVDYNLNSSTDEVVAISGRDLINSEVKLTFSYEEVFAEGVDYLAEVHNEVVDEYVENRFLNTFSVETLNRPITDVFQVYNETTGENYNVTRFTDGKIEFNGRQLPRVGNVENEIANFTVVTGENLYISEEIESSGSYKIIAANLQNDNISSGTGQYTGGNVNSSLSFSDSTLFLREFFYDNDLQTLAENLTKLSTTGDYLINYKDGIVYLYADPDQGFDLGEVNYTHASVKTLNSNIYNVNGLNYRKNVKLDPLLSLNLDSNTSEVIEVEEMPSAIERFLNGDEDNPILFGKIAFGEIGQYTVGSDRFIAPDANFIDDYADGYHTLRIVGDSDRNILSVVSDVELIVEPPFDDTRRGIGWSILDGYYAYGDGYKITTSYDVKAIRGIYTVTELQTLDKDSLTNYYDSSVDTFSGKTITLNNDLAATLSVDTALAIDYSFGNLYIDYDYIIDNVRVTYEYGDNSLNFSINDILNPGDEYFVSYEYGALREGLLTNFGALTQLTELTTVPLDFNRELYRDFLKGTLQGFVKGPTKESIETLVETVTKIKPEIRESSFDEWTLSRDNLYLSSGVFTGDATYNPVKHGNGLYIGEDNSLSYPSESYISYREGTFETWVKPDWNGLDNDATLTFSIGQDGYTADSDGYGLADGYLVNLDEIFIGSSGFNPTEMPFNLNKNDLESPIGRPHNYGLVPGYFIWYDDSNNDWVIVGVADPTTNTNLTGRITTTGEFYNVRDGYDGYSLEATDTIASTKSYIDYSMNFDGYETSDGYDGYLLFTAPDGYLFHDEIRFGSDNLHYIFDAGFAESNNRMSIYKDGSGYLNFRIFDDTGNRVNGAARQFAISTNISDWVANDIHMVSASWRLNSYEGIDEMHLFVDGQEVSNLFKYGGRPQTTSTDIYKTIASEELTASATKTIVGDNDGVSIAGSDNFTSANSDFINDGIVATDTLEILDDTADAGTYTILSVTDANTLVLDSSLTLSLSDINFSVNKTDFVVNTNIDVEKFAVFAVDGYGVTTELHGLSSIKPDYSISRVGGTNTLSILDNVGAGDQVYVNTLGLTQGRCRDITYQYLDGYSTIETRFAPPSNLTHFDIYKIPFMRTSIEANASPYGLDGYFTISGNDADGYFSNLCQPSETTQGKRYSVTLGGIDNIDFTGTNRVILYGDGYSGSTSETLTFTSYGTMTTTEYFTSLVYVDASFDGYDGYQSLGSLEIIEAIPFTQEENDGYYAIPTSYDNGVVTLITSETEDPYTLERCHYKFDYPTNLNIPMSKKGRLFIGTDINGANSLNGSLDQVIFLNDMLEDIRVGEDKSAQRTITQDYNSPLAATITPQTLMLLDLNENIKNIDKFYSNFDESFITTSSSVNEEFGDAGIFFGDPYVIDNGAVIFDNNQGSIEFWVSPLIDILNDGEVNRHYIDITSIETTTVTSTTAVTVVLNSKAKEILSVRLINDDGTGVNYFDKLAVDGKTITLNQSLPGQQTLIRVEYIPINFNGDRVTIYKDGYSNLNFSISANDELFSIATPISWNRGTWHRVMATWKTNSIDNTDRMRLFVDGVESGTVTYGTSGLLYGSGSILGTADVGTSAGSSLLNTITLTDTFGKIFIGNAFNFNGNSKSKIDNLRFSNSVRAPAVVAGSPIDINYSANLESVFPVIEDSMTTALYNFDMSLVETEFLANLLSENTPLFLFDVIIDDSFRRVVDNEDAKQLLIKIINRMKPSHSNLFIKFLQD